MALSANTGFKRLKNVVTAEQMINNALVGRGRSEC
jgi:hypothetical protein